MDQCCLHFLVGSLDTSDLSTGDSVGYLHGVVLVALSHALVNLLNALRYTDLDSAVLPTCECLQFKIEHDIPTAKFARGRTAQFRWTQVIDRSIALET